MRNYSYNMNHETGEFTKTFKNGDVLTVNWNDMPKETQDEIIFYGLKQHCSDRHSQAKELPEMIDISRQWAEDMENGVFRRRREGGLAELVVRALAQFKGVSVEEAQELIADYIPQDGDDDETTKEKKKVLTKLRNTAELSKICDDLSGRKPKSIDAVLSTAAPDDSGEEE